ncbi:MAG: hypothetical protein II976_05805 [Alistipes sp.]|nr:hypothetical protein [Alistipes sp.]
MKKLSMLVVLLTMALTTFAQEKDVTKFLGIPVDGTKAEMIAKLKEKGFTQVDYDEDIVLEGEFNGQDVYVYVGTNNRKVYRIMVTDKNKRNETDIRIRFNTLCQQFSENDKYISLEDYTIAEDERIYYQMRLRNKRYQAAYYQIDRKLLVETLLNKYTLEQLSNFNFNNLKIEDQINIIETLQNLCAHKQVWFMITEDVGEYSITMYYDNILNQANGDDL